MTEPLPAEVELTELQYEVLCVMSRDSEYCIGYTHLQHLATKDELRLVIKQLRKLGLVQYLRGLMTKDGEVAGSGFCTVYSKNQYIDGLIEKYESKPKERMYTEAELAKVLTTQKAELEDNFLDSLLKFGLIEKKDGVKGGRWVFKNTRIEPARVLAQALTLKDKN